MGSDARRSGGAAAGSQVYPGRSGHGHDGAHGGRPRMVAAAHNLSAGEEIRRAGFRVAQQKTRRKTAVEKKMPAWGDPVVSVSEPTRAITASSLCVWKYTPIRGLFNDWHQFRAELDATEANACRRQVVKRMERRRPLFAEVGEVLVAAVERRYRRGLAPGRRCGRAPSRPARARTRRRSPSCA